jgi:hypothetical protein
MGRRLGSCLTFTVARWSISFDLVPVESSERVVVTIRVEAAEPVIVAGHSP